MFANLTELVDFSCWINLQFVWWPSFFAITCGLIIANSCIGVKRNLLSVILSGPHIVVHHIGEFVDRCVQGIF